MHMGAIIAHTLLFPRVLGGGNVSFAGSGIGVVHCLRIQLRVCVPSTMSYVVKYDVGFG
jgi:hypothetical protein